MLNLKGFDWPLETGTTHGWIDACRRQ